MGFFKTKDPKTGEPRLGAGVYLIVCGLLIGGTVLWNLRKDANDFDKVPTGPVKTANPSVIAPVAQAVEQQKEVAPQTAATEVATQVTSTRNVDYKDETAKTEELKPQEDTIDTIQGTLDLLRENNDKAEKEKAEAVAKAKAEAEVRISELRKKALITASSPADGSNRPDGKPVATKGETEAALDPEKNTVSVNAGQLIAYDVTRDTPKIAVATTKEVTNGFTTQHFLPRGYTFPIYILSTVQTTGQEDMVIMGVAENVIFQHNVQLPFGTRLLGTAAASNFEDRVMINIDTILYPDGRELPISAFLKDASDLSSGVRGYYIPQPLRIQMVPYINEFVASYAEAVADRTRKSGDTSSSTSNYDAGNKTVTAASNLIRKQADKIQQRLDRRYPEKVVVPIGTKAFVQLRTALDLTRASIAGSLGNNQPILPGFENNPIRANGVIEKTANGGTAQITSATRPTTTGQSAATTQAIQQIKQNEASQISQSASEVQAYSQAMKQMDAISKSLDKMGTTPAKTTTSAPKVNWPSGDIE